ncbi:unnamed protein product [Schistocephalus solidus]|uniref:Secreted peptide n=1 Tax=Schistocephalus solidus TaxID=70667 RepID=A0A183SRK6_SCHSO|nr:unnamed protein product [Schistocephalus solidus]
MTAYVPEMAIPISVVFIGIVNLPPLFVISTPLPHFSSTCPSPPSSSYLIPYFRFALFFVSNLYVLLSHRSVLPQLAGRLPLSVPSVYLAR